MQNPTPSTGRYALTQHASDHERFQGLFDQVVELFESGEHEAAHVAFATLMAGMLRHVRVEEETLFPVFLERADGRGPAYAMMIEHRSILEALDEMREALAREDPSAFRVARCRLGVVLPGHFSKEERILFPLIETVIAEEGDGGELAERLRR